MKNESGQAALLLIVFLAVLALLFLGAFGVLDGDNPVMGMWNWIIGTFGQ